MLALCAFEGVDALAQGGGFGFQPGTFAARLMELAASHRYRLLGPAQFARCIGTVALRILDFRLQSLDPRPKRFDIFALGLGTSGHGGHHDQRQQEDPTLGKRNA
ncbi:MAG: hypothetical protein AMXMBFR6_08080 [Betaproteobacteria bacterium]